MYLVRWFNRKYPKSKDEIWCEFHTNNLEYFDLMKLQNYKVGKLTEDYIVHWDTKYKKGSLVLYKRIKVYDCDSWTGEFDYVGIFRAVPSYSTASGFLGFRSPFLHVEEITA